MRFAAAGAAAESGTWELYDMFSDKTETRNVAGQHPAIVKRLSRAYDQWYGQFSPATADRN